LILIKLERGFIAFLKIFRLNFLKIKIFLKIAGKNLIFD